MMKSQINIMRQLQEMVLIRDEHFQTGDGSHLDALNDSIDKLKSRLSPQVATIYERLYKKSHIVLAARTKGACSVCGMQIPTAQDQQVRLGQHLVTCSSCGRILFADGDDTPKNIAEKPDRDEVRVGICRFSAQELMIPELSSSTRDGAIEELATVMEAHNFIDNADTLVSGAIGRENILSTALGNGLAFPHVRGVEGGALTLALGVSKEGIDWEGEKVHMVFLSAIPVAVSAFYLRLLADLVNAFRKTDAQDAICACKSQEELWKTLVKLTKHYVK